MVSNKCWTDGARALYSDIGQSNFGTGELRHKKFGTNFEKFHLLRHKSLTSAHVIFFHGAEVNIPIELGAEVNIGCRSPQVGAEVTRAEHRLLPLFKRPSSFPSLHRALSETVNFELDSSIKIVIFDIFVNLT